MIVKSHLLSYDLCNPENIINIEGKICDAQSCSPLGLKELFIPRIEHNPRTNILRSCNLQEKNQIYSLATTICLRLVF